MTAPAWETLDSRVSYACEGFDIVTDTVRLPDGAETEFDYLSEPGSVVVLPLTPDGEVVVVDEWRQAVGRTARGLPAGTIEPDDTDPAAAARRELAEETGYEAGALAHLTTVEPANGFADAEFHYYRATECEPTAEQALEPDETIAVATTTRAALLSAAREDRLRDGRTAFALAYDTLFGGDVA